MIYFESEKSILVADRFNAYVTLSSSEQKFEKTVGTRFILACGSQLLSRDFRIAGTFVAMVTDEFEINAGMYVVIHALGYTASEQKFALLSEAPSLGSLTYIDGCSNSTLVEPSRNGDPCLNYLFFPPGIKQTRHLHPSYRIGLVIGGNGFAYGDSGATILKAGTAFLLRRQELHYFQTDNDPMGLLVFHPDSEDGPTDEANPMKTRTYLK